MNKGKVRPPPHQQAVNSQIQHLVLLFQRGDFIALERGARHFIRLFPQHIFGHKALIAALLQLNQAEQALSASNIAILHFPADPELHVNRAAACINCGLPEQAILSADQAINCAPDNAGAHANKGLALKQLGAWNPALSAYRRAIELNPNDHESLFNAGLALYELELPQQALACFQAAITLKPEFSAARNGVALSQECLKHLENARTELEDLLIHSPGDAEARSRLVQILRQDCFFSPAEQQTTIFLSKLRDDSLYGRPLPFNVLSMEGSTLDDQRIAGLRFAEIQMKALLNQPPLVLKSTARGQLDRPLRIGYLSADFFTHATTMLMVGILEAHDQKRNQIFIYSHGPDDGSHLRQRVKAACHTFRNIKSLSFIEAARQIVADQIDILVDLKGYTKDNRLEICALRPAPVIVSWLGYPGSLGHPRLADYVIGDPIVTPTESKPHYSEILALLPHCYQPNDFHRQLPPKPTRHALNLPEDSVVFCSFNQSYKLTDNIFEQWCRLLREVPNSVLWLMINREPARKNLIEKATKLGISIERLIFAEGMPIQEHLARLQQADIALDAFPYGSHTTGSDALWAGVPFVSIKGSTFASRVSSSLLHNVGLDELITDSPSSAVDLTITLALDRNYLSSIKNRLLAAKTTAPLFDTVRFTQNLERLFQAIWQDAMKGNDFRTPIILTDNECPDTP
jgi:predicted O-linked N-acetylglucosamine transferase (SPINDLY family)